MSIHTDTIHTYFQTREITSKNADESRFQLIDSAKNQTGPVVICKDVLLSIFWDKNRTYRC